MKRIAVLLLLLGCAIGACAQFSQKEFKQLCSDLSPQEAASISKNIRMMWEFEAEQNYASAVGMGLSAYETIRKSCGKAVRSKGYATLMDHLALDLSYVGHTAEALYVGREVAQLWREIAGEHSAEYVNAICNLATYYSQQHDRQRAELIVEEGLQICANDKKLRSNHAELLNTLVVLQLSSGQIEKALETYKELSALSLPMKDGWIENYIHALYSKGNYNMAIESLRNLLSKAQASKNVDGRKCAMFQYRLAYYLSRTGRYDEAEGYLQNAINNYRTNASTLNAEYARCLSLFSSIDDLKRRHEAALNKEKRSIEILKRLLPSNAPQLLNAQQHLVDMQFRHGDRAEALQAVYTCTRQDMQNMKYSMSMTQDVRSNIWASSSSWYTNALPYFASECKADSLLMLVYDGTLLAKGLLLNVDTNIAEEVAQGDSQLQKLYADWMQSKSLLESAQTLEAFQRAKQLSEQKENLFMRYYRQVSAVHERLNVTWNQVESALANDEMGIEIVAYPSDVGYEYAALIVKNGMKHPEMVVLCSEAELLSAYERKNLASLFYEKLLPFTKGVHKLYFSPTRKLYDIPLESMFLEELPQCEFSLYRVSSTRNLAISHKTDGIAHKAAIFGGIDYEASLTAECKTAVTQDGEHDTSKQDVLFSLRGADDSFPYLSGTLDESESINDILRSQAEVIMAIGAAGTESAFRGLAGRQTTMLHIATHGFYADAGNDEEFFWLPVFSDETKNQRTKEDEALSRSGLILAGATNTINGEEIASEMDGILTAQEISTLDFRGLDIVTLSACETAKGDITGDGVFGLQRGFTKAGANSLLMSLWKVDDAATCKLMTEFYSNWVTHKMTKHDALEAAKKTVRETPGWEDPKYWAAFILLDGLD